MRRQLLIGALLLFLASLIVFYYGSRFKVLVARAQGGPPDDYLDAYASYQFNNLNHPTGLVLIRPNRPDQGDAYFYLFIADSGNHVIRQFTSTLGTLDTVAGTLGSPGYVDGTNAKFNYPTGLSGYSTTWSECTCGGSCPRSCYTYYDYQNLYINDSQNYAVRQVCVGSPDPSNPDACNTDVTTSLHPVQTVSGTAAQPGYVDGPSLSATFDSLAGYTAGTPNYLADAGNHAIRAWDGVSVSTFAGTGSYGYVDGYRTNAQFNSPTKLTQDSSGMMYIADAGNNAIRRVDTAGNVTTLAGAGPNNPGLVDGQGSAASFFLPTSVVFNPADGYIYVADSHNNCIRRIDSAGNVSTYAGTGQPGLVNGPLLQAQFDKPADLVIWNGYMYISDSLNNVIRRIDMVNQQASTYIG